MVTAVVLFKPITILNLQINSWSVKEPYYKQIGQPFWADTC